MENFTRRVAGWFLLCLAMSMSLSAAAQQPPVERVDVETIPVQDDLEAVSYTHLTLPTKLEV